MEGIYEDAFGKSIFNDVTEQGRNFLGARPCGAHPASELVQKRRFDRLPLTFRFSPTNMSQKCQK